MTVSVPLRTHVRVDPAIRYFGTPVVLLVTTNTDEGTNVAPVSSVFWLGDRAVVGVAPTSHTWANLARAGEVVLALPSADGVDAVDRLALTTGADPVPPHKVARGYVHVADKLAHAGLTAVPSDHVTPPRLAECPVAMECVVTAMAEDSERPPVVELRTTQVHVHPDLVLAGTTDRIDPDRWRPLIMSFQHFYGLADGRVRPSRLASIDEELYR